MASNPFTEPENPTGSWNSAKFRKMLLIESIASVFSKQNSMPAIPPDAPGQGNRHEAISTDGTERKTVASKDPSEEEKTQAMTPVPTASSEDPILRQDRSSDGSNNNVQPGEIADLAADPMANRTEGGINYRSLKWW
jgi:hypothetical protein